MKRTLDNFLKMAGLLFVLLLLITVFAKCFSQQVELHLPKPSPPQWEITGQKLIGWTVMGMAGFVDGMVEGYEFDGRKSFERKFGASPNGFWGSESWRLAYIRGQPDNGFKKGWARHMGAMDFYHVGDDLRKIGYIGGTVTICTGKKRKWYHYALDIGIGMAFTSVGKRWGMSWIRS